MRIDPITLEVIRNGLLTAVQEMKAVVVKTAYSPLWKEAGDLSCGLLTPDCEVIAQGIGDIPMHLATMPFSLRGCLDVHPVEGLRPGDVLFQNDPYSGNNHLPDFLMAKPVFHGDRLLGFACVRGHWVDVGGMGPGSYSSVTRDIYAEGIRISPVKLYRQGAINEDILMVLRNNARNTKERMGDLRAQFAGTVRGDQRLQALAVKYGPAVLLQAMEQILDNSERLTRAEIRKIPSGRYTFEDYCDGDGVTEDLIKIACAVQVDGDEVVLDFTGSSPQVRGGMNAPYAVTVSASLYAIKCITDPWNPPNSGSYRPVKVIAPPGSVLNCRPPAPVVAGNHETASRVTDAVFGALAQAVPDRVIAACGGTSGILVVAGKDRRPGREREYVCIECHGSGQGASAHKDGVNATRVSVGNTGNTPTEALEINYPILVDAYEVIAGSGGPGRFRGGCSIRRRVRFLEEATVTLVAERAATAPYGLFGGLAARKSRFVLTAADGSVRGLPSKTPPFQVERGAVLDYEMAGGGGYGSPLGRDPRLVLRDVEDGYVSPESARDDYGVVLRASTGERAAAAFEIDVAATERRRRQPAGGGASR